MKGRALMAGLLLACSLSGGGAFGADPLKLTHPRFSYPTWSPDGARILFESSAGGNWDVWVMDISGLTNDGGNLTRLTNDPSQDRMPSWSPDGRHVVFVSDRDGDFEVFRMRADGSEQRQLTHNDVPEIHPYWTPGGERIVYNRRVGDQRIYEIRMMNPDGANDEIVLSDGELNSYAQMSPDGMRIVFDKWVDNNENNGEIFVLSLEDSSLTRLTDNEIYDGYPTWYPDGEFVLYASKSGEFFKLFRARIDGTEREQLTFGDGNDARADVSADGKRIVFNRELNGDVNIYVIDVEGN